MWLAVALSIVGLGLALLIVAGFTTWRRWQRMRRAGARFATRVDSLTVKAGSLADRRHVAQRLP